ncbi:MAG: hypothetical protein U0984_08625 [Prosthecobacter sp.]|nr:hypothetical protein [Prosthecobacter sp.]
MKTYSFLACTVAAALTLGFNAHADPGQSGSSQAPLSPATPAAPDPDVRDPSDNRSHDGVALVNGTYYLIRNQAASRLDSGVLPAGQMLADDGRLVPIPDNVSGLGATGGARAVAGANTTADPNRTAVLEKGVVMQNGNVYIVHNGKAMQVDIETKKGQMLTFDGKVISIPEGVIGLTDGPAISTNPASPAKPIVRP